MPVAPSTHTSTARDWMSPPRLWLAPQTDILAAINDLVRLKVHAAPVLDPQGRLLGILTEKDCLRVLSTSAYEGQVKGGTVADYMSPVSVLIEPDMDLFRAAEQFLRCNFPTLPVVENGKLLGRIDRQDMLRGIQDLTQHHEDRRREQERLSQVTERPRSIEEMQRTVARESKENLVKRLTRA